MILKNSMFLLCMGACFLSVVLWSNQQSMPGQEDIFTLMSFNIRRDGPEKKSIHKWAKRKRFVCELLQSTKPSIMCLQEVVVNQLCDIVYSLSGYDWVGKQSRGSQWFGMAKDEHLPIFYDRSRFKVFSSGWLVLNQGTANPFQWKKYGRIKRIATWVHLIDVVAKKDFFVYNVHLDHDYDTVRCSSVSVLIAHINAHVKSDQMVFVAGDFNAVFDGKIRELFNNNGFIHIRKLAQSINGPVNTAIDWNGKEKYSIDHILVRPGEGSNVDILDYQTIKTAGFDILPSDHYPIVAKIAIK